MTAIKQMRACCRFAIRNWLHYRDKECLPGSYSRHPQPNQPDLILFYPASYLLAMCCQQYEQTPYPTPDPGSDNLLAMHWRSLPHWQTKNACSHNLVITDDLITVFLLVEGK